MDMPNIAYKGNIPRDIFAKDDNFEQISYYKTLDDFENDTVYSKFIKAVETLVRTSNDYKAFLKYIKETLGLDFCQVFSKIHDGIDAKVEFHHGPIFTLYDICENELLKFLRTGQRVNTFRLANSVLDLHFAMKINGVLLSETVHESAHNGDVFLNINQSIGDINWYIAEYAKYFTPEMKYKIYRFVEMCKATPSFDTGALDMEVVKEYIKPVSE